MGNKSTRRKFLGTTAAASAAGWAAASLYAADAKSSPGDMINLGVIGCGARARQMLSKFKKLSGNRVVAVCDVNSKHKEQLRQACGGKLPAYHDYRKLIENKQVDAVLVATQAHWHVLPTIAACRAGKDVYLEKPLSNFIGEGRFAVEAARKYDRIVQIGTQQRSWEQHRRAVEVVQSGRLGEISEVKVWDYSNWFPGRGSPPDCDPPRELDWDFYIGPSPYRNYNPNHYYGYGYDWFTFSGAGHQLAWGVHHYDIVNWAMGVNDPISAVAMGGKFAMPDDNHDWPDTLDAVIEYGPGPVAKKGFVLQYTMRLGSRREFRAHGKCFFGTHGSMIVDRAGYTITSEYHGKGDKRKKVIKEESFRSKEDNHQEVFLANVRQHKRPFADVEVGYYSALPGHLMNISYLTGRKIRWDGQKGQIIDDPEANALVMQPYRAPWKLEI